MLADSLYEFHLLLWTKSRDDRLNDSTERNIVDCDETVIVHVGEETHYELTIHAVSNSTVAWNGITKVLDLEGTLETGGKEAPKRSDQRGKCGEEKDMDLHGCHHKALGEGKPDREIVDVLHEDWIWYALKSGEDVCAEVLGIIIS